MTSHTGDSPHSPAADITHGPVLPADNREVAASLVNRVLTKEHVLLLPDTMLRRVLIAGIGIAATAGFAGYDNRGPTPVQLVNITGSAKNPHALPMVLPVEETRPAKLLDFLCDLADRVGPDQVRLLASGQLSGKAATVAAAAIFYHGWSYPPGHPAEDMRDPEDVPFSVATRFVQGLTPDNVAFTVARPSGQQPTVEVELLPPGDSTTSDPADVAPNQVRTALARLLTHLVRAHATSTDPPPTHASTVDDLHSPYGQALHISTAAGHPLDTLTPAEVEALPESDLRSIALLALDMVERFHSVSTWADNRGHVVRYTRRDLAAERRGNIAMIPEPAGHANASDMLMEIAAELGRNGEVRAHLRSSGHDYLAVALLTEAWCHVGPPVEGRRVADTPGAHEAAYMVGVTRRGGLFHIVHPRHGSPHVSLAVDLDDAAQRFYVDEFIPLQVLNRTFIDLDPNTAVPAEPTAGLDQLPPLAEFGDDRFVMVSTRWKMGQPRQGPIYPALPGDHAFAQKPCACKEPLADGTPVQTLVVSPAKPDDTDRFMSGQWCEVHAALIHQRCVDGVVTQLARVVISMHRAQHRKRAQRSQPDAP